MTAKGTTTKATRRILWSASPWRALAESVVACAGLLLIVLVAGPGDSPAAASRGVAFSAAVAGAAAALRLSPPEGSLRRRIGRDLAFGAALAVLLPAASAVVTGLFGVGQRLDSAYGGTVSALLILAQAGSTFVALRVLSLVWQSWDRLRRGRLIWALTHAHLVVVVVAVVGLACLVGLFLVGTRFPPPSGESAADPLSYYLTLALDLALPAAGALVLLTGLAVALVLPPVALVSYFVARRTTGRLELLARATSSLRTGEYGVRVPVDGEDEVAQLQSNFNAMAADLQRTLAELETERSRVAGLLQERRELVAAVSHELRTPVATLRGYLESIFASGDSGLAPELRQDLAVMDRETARLNSLIEDLFALASVEAGKLALRPAPTDVGALVCQSVETAAPLAWRTGRVQVVAEMPPDLPLVVADPDRLAQVLTNLLRNAVRHTSPGGIVAVAARADESSIVLEVHDTGEGISPEDLPHVFERFYRGASGERGGSDGGAGLGLALVRELTEAMGGATTAQSALGEGSVFTVRLPRASE